MQRLSDVRIRALVNAKMPIAKSDGQGLTFTLSASGRASWVLRYRHGNKAKEKTLGQYPDISLAEARKLASEDRVKIQQGIDVAAEKQRSKRETSVYPREIVKEALQENAAAVILAHNHPSGVATPSSADKTLTSALKQALSLVDVKVLDHFIVAGASSLSFAERGLL